VAESAERFQVDVADAGGVQRSRQVIGAELRIAAGFRDGADVDEPADAVGLKQPNKSSIGRVEWPMVNTTIFCS